MLNVNGDVKYLDCIQSDLENRIQSKEQLIKRHNNIIEYCWMF
jgi:hypothetical protein